MIDRSRQANLALGLLMIMATTVMSPVCIGVLLPMDHTVARTAVINKHPRDVWEALVIVQDDFEGVPITVLSEDPPKRRVTHLEGENRGFGVTWETTLEREGLQTRVTIVEQGQTYNPVFRFLGRYVYGRGGRIEGVLDRLGNQFYQDVEISEPGD